MRIIKAKLRNGDDLEFGDINIFVGPNGVGKSTILNELFNSAVRSAGGTHWVKQTELEKISKVDASRILKHTRKVQGQWNLFYYKKNAHGELVNEGTQVIRDDTYVVLQQLAENNGEELSEQQETLIRYRHLFMNLIGFESTKNRLGLKGEIIVGDALNPESIYDHINNDPNFLKEIDKHFFEIFGHHFHLLKHRQKFFNPGFSKVDSNPSEDDPKEAELWREENLIPIDNAGDGMHASAKVFFSLLNPDFAVVLIDEPEIFVYPSQKKRIARVVKDLAIKIGEKQGKQTFIVTHDATFLAGLVDNAQEGEDIRIFYIKDRNKIVPISTQGSEILPTTKQEKYLQMLFHHGVVISEGPNDRFFYEETINEIHKKRLNKKDIAFIEMGGASNGAMQIARLIKHAEVKAAFVFDLDVITKSDDGNYETLEKVFCILSGEKEFPELEKLRKLIIDNKKTSIYTKEGIKDLDWHRENISSFEEVFNKLIKYGIFIVPHGPLENWAGKGKNFPYSASEKIVSAPNTKGFKEFSGEILDYLLGVENKTEKEREHVGIVADKKEIEADPLLLVDETKIVE